MFDLTDRTALITGASSGLGAHFARVLARAGADVILAARRVDALTHVQSLIEAEGGRARCVKLDVTQAEDLQHTAQELFEADILVNNAGLVRNANALEQTEADWDVVVDTNLKGAFFLAQSFARARRNRGRVGCIINVASILGLRQAGGVLPYAVSKAGLIQTTKVLALELARHRIRVNAIAPGYFETDINREFWATPSGRAMLQRIPQRRLGRFEDLDGALLFLSSDASSYVTGTVLTVDGGHLVSGL